MNAEKWAKQLRTEGDDETSRAMFNRVADAIDALTAERDEWKRKAERAIEVLKKVRWKKEHNNTRASCVYCGRWDYYGCFSDCELAAILNDKEKP